MKTCKACKLEIHEKATKCRYCRSNQSPLNTWILILGTLMLLPLSLYTFNTITDKAIFADYKNQVTYTHISDQIIKLKSGNERLKIIGEINNQSKKDWILPDFKISFKKENGNFVGAYYETSSRVKALAGTTTKVSATAFVGKMPEDYTFEVELIDMREKR